MQYKNTEKGNVSVGERGGRVKGFFLFICFDLFIACLFPMSRVLLSLSSYSELCQDNFYVYLFLACSPPPSFCYFPSLTVRYVGYVKL